VLQVVGSYLLIWIWGPRCELLKKLKKTKVGHSCGTVVGLTFPPSFVALVHKNR
jgi:hypothetical protein